MTEGLVSTSEELDRARRLAMLLVPQVQLKFKEMDRSDARIAIRQWEIQMRALLQANQDLDSRDLRNIYFTNLAIETAKLIPESARNLDDFLAIFYNYLERIPERLTDEDSDSDSDEIIALKSEIRSLWQKSDIESYITEITALESKIRIQREKDPKVLTDFLVRSAIKGIKSQTIRLGIWSTEKSDQTDPTKRITALIQRLREVQQLLR